MSLTDPKSTREEEDGEGQTRVPRRVSGEDDLALDEGHEDVTRKGFSKANLVSGCSNNVFLPNT